jgi:NADPH-dependent 2,4-dienoyl-CoA reductase/sulfur reductase-like enzyme
MSSPVVIIGAGPAGLECARTLSCADVPVVLIDDNAKPGGQYFRQLPAGFAAGRHSRLLRDAARGRALAQSVVHPRIRFMPDTTAWMSPRPGVVAYAGEQGSGRIEASLVVLATGAHDKPIPFPGWTMPGVVSAGGVLNLAKGQAQALGGRVVVAGNGPLLLVVAATLIAAGSRVTHVVECSPARQAWAALPGIARAPALLFKGLDYRRRLLAHGTRFLSGWTVMEASGEQALSGIRIAPLADDGTPRGERSRRLALDWLVTGFGLQPSSEFARHIGCEMRFDAERGGWIAKRNADLETTVANVFAIGDGAGIGGVEVALAEGAVLANVLLARLGRGAPALKSARDKLERLEHFRTGLARLYRAPAPRLADGATMICRCEEVRSEEVDAAIAAGATDLVRLKSALRLGMGRCQGRNCYTSAAIQLAQREGGAVGDYPLPRARGPVRPIRIRHLFDEPLGAAREPDSISLFEQKENSR